MCQFEHRVELTLLDRAMRLYGVVTAKPVEPGSGVNALNCACWADLAPAPVEELRWPSWELDKMAGALCPCHMHRRPRRRRRRRRLLQPRASHHHQVRVGVARERWGARRCTSPTPASSATARSSSTATPTATMASPTPPTPRDVPSMVLAAVSSRTGALSIHAAKVLDEMWSRYSPTTAAVFKSALFPLETSSAPVMTNITYAKSSWCAKDLHT